MPWACRFCRNTGSGHWPTDRQMLDDVLVNESFARSLSLKGESVIGRHISGSFVTGTIIGVVADFKYSQLDTEPLPEIYASYELAPVMTPMSMDIFVRMSGNRKPDARAIEKTRRQHRSDAARLRRSNT